MRCSDDVYVLYTSRCICFVFICVSERDGLTDKMFCVYMLLIRDML